MKSYLIAALCMAFVLFASYCAERFFGKKKFDGLEVWKWRIVEAMFFVGVISAAILIVYGMANGYLSTSEKVY